MALLELRIRDLAVVREAHLEPGTGFTVVTGETGAGKSVCVSALRLALGGRTEGDVTRPGAQAARIAAVFDGIPDRLRERLDALGVPQDDLVTLAREVPRSGRSTARINGALVSQATLAEVGEALAEVTLQGASQRLLQRSQQRQLLDAYGGPAAGGARDAMARSLAAWREAQVALAAAVRAAQGGAEELVRAREVVELLGPLRLAAGEDAALAAEAARLRNAAGVIAAAEAIRAAAGGGDDQPGAADLIAAAVEAAREPAAVDPALRAVVVEATELVHRLRDLVVSSRECSAAVALDETRLAAVEERLDTLARVRRRHGSIEAALASLAAAEELLAGAAGGGGDLSRLEQRQEACRRDAVDAAIALTQVRRATAARLGAAVTERLRQLELPHARLQIDLRSVPDANGLDLGAGPVRCAAHGTDEVVFSLATNRDAEPRTLDSGPSGGELSRLALAVASVASDGNGSLLVFDEVDSGVSGETAARVGDLLAVMGRDRQVLAVTHRSEIAARAGAHLLAVKRETPAGAETEIHALTGAQRTREIARLMSGRTTEAAMRRAGELLVEGTTVPDPVAAAP